MYVTNVLCIRTVDSISKRARDIVSQVQGAHEFEELKRYRMHLFRVYTNDSTLSSVD